MLKNSVLDACMASIRMSSQNAWTSTTAGMVTQNGAKVLRFSGESYLKSLLNLFPFEWETKPLLFLGASSHEIEEAFYSFLFQEGAEDNVLEVAKKAAKAVSTDIDVWFIGDLSEIEHDGFSSLRGFYFTNTPITEECFICGHISCNCA